MDDGLRDFGEMPGYEFDLPRASGQPRPGAGGGERRWQTWQRPPAAGQPPAGQPRPQRPPGQWRQAPPAPAPAAGPGRSTLLARDTLAAMRARNWLISLAVPLLAAIAVGVAGVVVLGANNGSDAAAPSALAAGFPPARSAAADFGGDGPAVEVSAIAGAGATEVAAGSANRGCALWVSADGGSTWRRAALTLPAAGRDGAGQLAGVAHGPSGWLAVGGASAGAGAGAALRPAVVGSPDGRTWTAAGGEAAFAGPGRIVTAAVAAGRAGYVIVGQASAGPRTVAAAWYAPGLRGWRRAAGTTPGALDGPGNRAMNAVSATSRGFVAVGAVGARPAAWLSGTGRSWTLETLALPAGAVGAAFDYVAANGAVVAAVGTEVTAAGQRRPFAVVSTDAGAAWTPARLPLPAGGGPAAAAAATALTAAGGGFTATGAYGPPGETDVVVWTLAAGAAGAAGGTAWTEVAPAGTGLAGPGRQAITALTATGATLTGVGFVSAPTSAATAMLTEPTIWQSPVRS
jgi:hypothetical protein